MPGGDERHHGCGNEYGGKQPANAIGSWRRLNMRCCRQNAGYLPNDRSRSDIAKGISERTPKVSRRRISHFWLLHRQLKKVAPVLWCGRSGSNRHSLRNGHLKPARLPIPPRPHIGIYIRRGELSQPILSPRLLRSSCLWPKAAVFPFAR